MEICIPFLFSSPFVFCCDSPIPDVFDPIRTHWAQIHRPAFVPFHLFRPPFHAEWNPLFLSLAGAGGAYPSFSPAQLFVADASLSCPFPFFFCDRFCLYFFLNAGCTVKYSLHSPSSTCHSLPQSGHSAVFTSELAGLPFLKPGQLHNSFDFCLSPCLSPPQNPSPFRTPLQKSFSLFVPHVFPVLCHNLSRFWAALKPASPATCVSAFVTCFYVTRCPVSQPPPPQLSIAFLIPIFSFSGNPPPQKALLLCRAINPSLHVPSLCRLLGIYYLNFIPLYERRASSPV